MQTSITLQNKKIKYVIVTLLWLAIWEGIALLINQELLFASPIVVVKTLLRFITLPSFWETIGLSILRVVGGFICGFILASTLAILAHKFSFFKLFITPMINVIKATPVASFIILALIWAGKNFVPVLICILMVMPIVYSNVLSGLSSVDNGLLEMAKVYKMKGKAKALDIYMPTLVPFLAAATSAGLGLCWKAGIAAEVICRTLPSIGNSIWETKFYLLTDEMFTWTTVVVLLSVTFETIVRKLMARITKKYKYEEETK